MKLAILKNEIEEAIYKETTNVPIILTRDEQSEYNNSWKTYREWQAHLENREDKPSQ